MAMLSVPTAISARVTISPVLRPTRSMNAPRKIAPSGRIKKPTPNAAKDCMSEAVASVFGKYTRAMKLA